MKLTTILFLLAPVAFSFPIAEETANAFEKNEAPALHARNHEFGAANMAIITQGFKDITDDLIAHNTWVQTTVTPLSIFNDGPQFYQGTYDIAEEAAGLAIWIEGAIDIGVFANAAEAAVIKTAVATLTARYATYYGITVVGKKMSIRSLAGLQHREKIKDSMIKSKEWNKTLFDALLARTTAGSAAHIDIAAKWTIHATKANEAIAVC